MNLNRVIIVGHLVAKPELKTLPSGAIVSNFRIASNRTWKDAKNNNEKREEVCFIDVAAFDKRATFANQWFEKGNQILVEGRLKQDRWKTTAGETRTKHSIVADSLGFVDPATKRQSAVPVDDTAVTTPSTETTASDAAPLPAAPASPKPSVNVERSLVAAGVTTDDDLPF
ncbi:MAG TPA: single-stranded DNA-binding protein [Planctomycetota bacterium]|nr:single-stranded DNA-binding protein [Planctomycetota bacterium]